MGSSNTDDSGYEAGYETDADESELSEWESGTSRRGHKRKLEALVHLTMRLNFAESSDCAEDGTASSSMTQMPPPKTTRALGTKPAGLRLSLAGVNASSCNSAFGNTTLAPTAACGSSAAANSSWCGAGAIASPAATGLTMGSSPLPTARTAAMVLPAFMPAPSLPESVLQAADAKAESTRVM